MTASEVQKNELLKQKYERIILYLCKPFFIDARRYIQVIFNKYIDLILLIR